MRWLLNLEANADCVLVLGSRMRKSQSVRVAQTVAMKAIDHDRQIMEGSQEVEPEIQGLCIINEQYTSLDNICQVRLWGENETIMKKICKELKVSVTDKPKMAKFRWKSHVPPVFHSAEKIDPAV